MRNASVYNRRAREIAGSHDDCHDDPRENFLYVFERHRLPALSDALRRLELRLDELEQEERVVTRWARRRRQGQFAGPAASTNPDNSGDVTN